MLAIASLLLVVALSLLVVRVGAIALTMTGLSPEVARFQALSAFSGAGFTTSESERVVATPARRRVLATLIRLGSAGVVTAISTLVLSFAGDQRAEPQRLLVLGLGVAGLVALARSRRLERWTTPLIRRALRRATTLDLRDYASLLHLREDYRVSEVVAEPGSWLTERRLDALDLGAEGVTVLGIEHADGGYEGAPGRAARLAPGDRVLLYGKRDRLEELSGRRAGDEGAHEAAKDEAEGDGTAQGA